MTKGGMHGEGGVCMGYDEIRSVSGRYASHWNAFLFKMCLDQFIVCKNEWCHQASVYYRVPTSTGKSENERFFQ